MGTASVLAGFLGEMAGLSWVLRRFLQAGVGWDLTSAPHSYRHHLLPSGSLRLAQAQASDSGLYECTASNPAGSASRHYVLGVQGRAKLWLLSYLLSCPSFCFSQCPPQSPHANSVTSSWLQHFLHHPDFLSSSSWISFPPFLPLSYTPCLGRHFSGPLSTEG